MRPRLSIKARSEPGADCRTVIRGSVEPDTICGLSLVNRDVGASGDDSRRCRLPPWFSPAILRPKSEEPEERAPRRPSIFLVSTRCSRTNSKQRSHLRALVTWPQRLEQASFQTWPCGSNACISVPFSGRRFSLSAVIEDATELMMSSRLFYQNLRSCAAFIGGADSSVPSLAQWPVNAAFLARGILGAAWRSKANHFSCRSLSLACYHLPHTFLCPRTL